MTAHCDSLTKGALVTGQRTSAVTGVMKVTGVWGVQDCCRARIRPHKLRPLQSPGHTKALQAFLDPWFSAFLRLQQPFNIVPQVGETVPPTIK